MHTPLFERLECGGGFVPPDLFESCLFAALRLRDCESSFMFLTEERKLYTSDASVPFQLIADMRSYRNRRTYFRQSLAGRGLRREGIDALVVAPSDGLGIMVHSLLSK